MSSTPVAMERPADVTVAILVFALVYAVADVAASWISINWIGWSDPAFGNRAGQMRIQLQVVPLFAAIATAGNAAAVVSRRTTLRQIPRRTVLAAQGVAAIVVVCVTVLLSAVFGMLPNRLGPLVSVVGTLWLFLGSAVVTLAVMKVVASRY